MRHRWLTQLLTLVLCALVCSPSQSAPGPTDPQLDEPSTNSDLDREKIPAERIDSIDITEVKGDPFKANDFGSSEYFYPYRRSVSPRLGTLFNSSEYADDKSILYLVGFQLLFQDQFRRSFEGGLDLVSNGTGRAHFSHRWFHSRSRFRPFSKVGLGVKIIPKNGLATLVKFDNWQARGAIGFEHLLLAPLSFRCELEAAVGPRDFEAAIVAGYSWAW